MEHSKLLDPDDRARNRDEREAAIAAMISQPQFPCVGAKSALARDNLKVIAGHSLGSNWDDLEIYRELLDWAREYRDSTEGLRSLAVIFDGPLDLSETEFENLLWARIQSLADKDAWLGQDYDSRVSSDPGDPHFSLSFGGRPAALPFRCWCSTCTTSLSGCASRAIMRKCATPSWRGT